MVQHNRNIKTKKLIFNPKNIEKRKQILKYKDYVPGNFLTVQGKPKKKNSRDK